MSYTCNSHPNVSLSLVEMTGRTKLSAGISETRENKKIAASKDRKNTRAPAKKKFPMLQSKKKKVTKVVIKNNVYKNTIHIFMRT